jgi:hypothetical protein
MTLQSTLKRKDVLSCVCTNRRGGQLEKRTLQTDHFEVPSEDVKLSDSFAAPAVKKPTELGHHPFGQLTGRQMSQAKSAKLLLLQELNYEEVKVLSRHRQLSISGPNVIKLFTVVIYRHFMVIPSFCVIKQHYLGNFF